MKRITLSLILILTMVLQSVWLYGCESEPNPGDVSDGESTEYVYGEDFTFSGPFLILNDIFMIFSKYNYLSDPLEDYIQLSMTHAEEGEDLVSIRYVLPNYKLTEETGMETITVLASVTDHKTRVDSGILMNMVIGTRETEIIASGLEYTTLSQFASYKGHTILLVSEENDGRNIYIFDQEGNKRKVPNPNNAVFTISSVYNGILYYLDAGTNTLYSCDFYTLDNVKKLFTVYGSTPRVVGEYAYYNSAATKVQIDGREVKQYSLCRRSITDIQNSAEETLVEGIVGGFLYKHGRLYYKKIENGVFHDDGKRYEEGGSIIYEYDCLTGKERVVHDDQEELRFKKYSLFGFCEDYLIFVDNEGEWIFCYNITTKEYVKFP